MSFKKDKRAALYFTMSDIVSLNVSEKEKDWKFVKICEFKFRLSFPENVFKAEDLHQQKKLLQLVTRFETVRKKIRSWCQMKNWEIVMNLISTYAMYLSTYLMKVPKLRLLNLEALNLLSIKSTKSFKDWRWEILWHNNN